MNYLPIRTLLVTMLLAICLCFGAQEPMPLHSADAAQETNLGSITLVNQATPDDGTTFDFIFEQLPVTVGTRLNAWFVSDPFDVAIDASGNIYVVDLYENQNRVVHLDANGRPLESLLVLDLPRRVAIALNSNVYVTSSGNDVIRMYDTSGYVQNQWGSSGSGNGQFNEPYGIATDNIGNVYVTDAGNNRVQKFDINGTYITQWGMQGSGNGQFDFPTDIAVDASNNVYIADLNNNRIQKFDANGAYLTQWGEAGSDAGQFDTPYGIAVDIDGDVYVADTGNNRIQKFDSDGLYLTRWDTGGAGVGQLQSPIGIDVDMNGNIYVAESSTKRILRLSSSKAYIEDRASGDSQTFTDLASGRYMLASTTPGGWMLDSITCDNGVSTTPVNDGIVIDLTTEHTTCTFTHTPATTTPSMSVTVCPSGGDFITIQSAINAVPSGGTVEICAGTFPENLKITKDLTLRHTGLGSTAIRPTNSTTVQIRNGANVIIENLTLSATASDSDLETHDGSAIDNRGQLTLKNVVIVRHARGLINRGGQVTITDSQINNNEAYGGIVGAGIYNDAGIMTIRNTTLIGNSGSAGRDDPPSSGAGIFNTGTIIVADSIIRNSYGWNIIDNSGNLTFENSQVINNQAVRETVNNSNQMSVKRSTVSGNSVGPYAGDYCVDTGGFDNQGNLQIIESTIADNGGGCKGGALHTQDESASTIIKNSTITQNSSSCESTGTCYEAGITVLGGSLQLENNTIHANSQRQIFSSGGTIFASNSIIGGSTDLPNCEILGTLISQGNNIDTDDSCGFNAVGDQSNADPLLGPLQDNGGPSRTLALLPGSLAIDAGDNANCPPTDQRGIARPQGAGCDIGAFEFKGGNVPTPTLLPPTPTPIPPTPTPVPLTPTPVPPTPTPPSSGCGPLTQEAEAGILAGAWTIGNDGNASGGQYIVVPDSDGQVSAAAINRHSATYCFRLDTPGTYQLRGWVYAADGNDNSIFLTVDGQPAEGYIWDLPLNTSYEADLANDRNGVDPLEFTLAAGDHTIVINSREDGAHVDKLALELVGTPSTPTPIPPTPTPPPSGCGPLTQEAEAGILAGAWTIGNDGNASGGQYIVVPDSDGQASAATINRHSATYCFDVTTPGTYRLRGWVYAADGNDNSIFLTVDDQPVDGYVWNLPLNTTYETDLANDRNGVDPLAFTLAAGDHTIVLNSREDGARIDKLLLELVGGGNPTPTPQPPSCGALSQEAENGELFGKFAIFGDPAASGGQYVAMPDTDVNSAGVTAANLNIRHRADYCITVAEAGDYRIRTQVLAPDNQGNSFFVQVDGAPEDGTLYDIFPVNGEYVTDYVSQRDGADPVIYTLTPGDHTISFILREDGARLDSFTLEPVNVAAASVHQPTVIEIEKNLREEVEEISNDSMIVLPLVIQ